MCALQDLQEFHHGRKTSMRTDFGQYNLMKLVSSWPKLRIVSGGLVSKVYYILIHECVAIPLRRLQWRPRRMCRFTTSGVCTRKCDLRAVYGGLRDAGADVCRL